MGGHNTNIKRKHPIARPGHSSVLQRDGTPQASSLYWSTSLEKPANSRSVAQTAQTLMMIAALLMMKGNGADLVPTNEPHHRGSRGRVVLIFAPGYFALTSLA